MGSTDYLIHLGRTAVSVSGAVAVSAATQRLAATFKASRTGNITSVVVPVGAITNPRPSYQVRIVAVDGGLAPTGGDWSTSTTGTFAPVANSYNLVTLTSPASVTVNSVYGVVIQHASGTISGSRYCSFGYYCPRMSSVDANRTAVNAGWSSTDTGATYSRHTGSVPQLIPRYSDGVSEAGASAAFGIPENFNFQTTSVTDYGCRFTAPMACQLVGAFTSKVQIAAQPRTLRLLNLSSNVLTSASDVTAIVPSVASSATFLWLPTYNLVEGQDYRLVYTATTTTAQAITAYPAYDSESRLRSFGPMYHTFRQSSAWNDRPAYASLVVPVLRSPVGGEGSPAILCTRIGRGGRIES